MLQTVIGHSLWLDEVKQGFDEPLCDGDVAVIGGGIMGIAVTYWLARSGCSVNLLEAGQLASGATGRNAGLVLAGSRPLEASGMLKRVIEEEQLGDLLQTTGHLALASSESVWQKICAEASKRASGPLPVFALDHRACEEHLHLRLSTRFYGGRWLPSGAVTHPTRLAVELAQASLRYGAHIKTETRVEHLEHMANGSYAIDTTAGRVRAQQVVVACGNHLKVFAPEFSSLINPVRGQVMATSPLPPLFANGMAVDWGTVYWRQVSSGSVIVGGYRNLEPDVETSDHANINPKIQLALAGFLKEAFPDIPPYSVVRQWAGIMDFTKDNQPLIGVRPGWGSQWIIAGFGGHGLPAALAAGRALAEAIITGKVPEVLGPYDPARFWSSTNNHIGPS